MTSQLQKVHEHIIQVSSKELHLTRAQISNGLLDLIRNPKEYLPHLEDVHTEEVKKPNGEIVFFRSFDFGPYCVEDKVVFIPEEQATTHVQETENIPNSMMIIKIEEPAKDDLFLRFSYFEDPEKSPLKDFPQGASIRKQAWEGKDQLFAQLIVDKAKSGAFSTLQ
jgi:hypothetical protein